MQSVGEREIYMGTCTRATLPAAAAAGGASEARPGTGARPLMCLGGCPNIFPLEYFRNCSNAQMSVRTCHQLQIKF